MRCFAFQCILLISLSIVSAADDDHPKQKRDLAFVKKVFTSAFFNKLNDNGNHKIFRIPGFNKILVKAVPKGSAGTVVPVSGKVGVIAQDPTVALVGSYLGTKTPVDTLNALEGVKNLLASGILTASRDAMPITFQPPSVRFISAIRKTATKPISPVVIDSTKIYNGVTEIQKPVYVVPNIAERTVLAYEIPNPMIPIVPSPMVPVPVPTLPTNYSYKQIHQDGTMTSYTANNNHDVTVMKSDKPLPLPPFMAYRLREVIKLGTQMVGVGMPVPIMSVVQPPVVQFIDYPKINPYTRVKPQVIGINNNNSYKQVHNDGTMTAYSGSGSRGLNKVQVITDLGTRPVVPAFISDRLENVVASTVSSKLPNPVVLAGQTVIPTYRYSTMVTGYPTFNTKENVKVKINNNLNHNAFTNIKPAGAFSYQTVHKDGSVTAHAESGPEQNIKIVTGQSFVAPYLYTPLVSAYPGVDTREIVKVIATNTNGNFYHQPAAHRIANIAKVNDSFSYRIVHDDGTVTDYGASEVIHDKKGNNHLYTNPKLETTHSYESAQNVVKIPTTPVLPSNKIDNIDKDGANNAKMPSGSFSYKLVHSDVTNTQDQSAVQEKAGISTLGTTTSNVNSTPGFTYKLIHSKLALNNGKQESSSAKSVHKATETVNTELDNSNSFSYKTVHNDGSVTSYTKQDVMENTNTLVAPSINIPEETKVDIKSQDNSQNLPKNNNVISIGSSGYSYKLVHNAKSTNNDVQTENSLAVTPVSVAVASSDAVLFNNPVVSSYTYKQIPTRPLSPALLSDKIDNIAKNNAGSFSYRIEHSDGTETSYDASGKHIGKSKQSQTGEQLDEKRKIPFSITATGVDCAQPIVLCRQHVIDAENNAKLPSGSFSYKLVHSDVAHTLDPSGVLQKAGISTPVTTTSDIEKDKSTSGFSYKLVQNALVSENDEPRSSSAKSVHKATESVNTQPRNSNSYSYKTVHSDSSVTSYTKQGAKENNSAKLVATSINTPEKLKVDFNSQNLPKNNNVASSIGSSGHSYKLIHNAISTNNDVQIANSLAVTPVSVAVASSDAVLFNNPVVSSYTYKQIYHNSPNNFTVVKLDGPIHRDKVAIGNDRFPGSGNINSKVETIPNDYVYIPPTSANIPSLTKHEKMPLSDGYVYMPPASANAPLPIKPLIHNERNVQKDTQASSLSSNPIVVLDDPMIFSYQQSKSDGSSVNVEGSKNTVSVKVSPQKTNRGDIPDEPY